MSDEEIAEVRASLVRDAHGALWEERLLATVDRERAAREKAETCLAKIDAIRNSIIGRQGVNWSDHIYPLVAALGEAGYPGEGYDVAHKKEQGLFDRLEHAEARVVALEKLFEMRDDGPLPEDEAIKAAHPTRTDQHELYGEAMRLVSGRHSKGGLTELVNWLLSRVAKAEAALAGYASDGEIVRQLLKAEASCAAMRSAAEWCECGGKPIVDHRSPMCMGMSPGPGCDGKCPQRTCGRCAGLGFINPAGTALLTELRALRKVVGIAELVCFGGEPLVCLADAVNALDKMKESR
jgi:hypothetical protein